MSSSSPALPAWRPAQTRAQWLAIARLRWRIFRNNLFCKGERGEWIVRLIAYPLLAALFLLPALGAVAGAFFIAQSGHLDRLPWLLWAVFLLAQFANINLGQPGTAFDPTLLIRFPLSLRHFVLLRLFFGVLSPANILVVLMGCAVAVGLGTALPRLWPFTVPAMLVFVTVNVLFGRMVFAWVDRWLSTRRAREIFTAFLFLGSLGMQYVNISFNTGYNRHPQSATAPRANSQSTNRARWKYAGLLYDRARPVLDVLPPELTAHALQGAQQNRPSLFAGKLLACAAYGALFLLVFALRMRTEFRGEALSDQAYGGSASKPARSPAAPLVMPVPRQARKAASRWLPLPVRAVLYKELLYARRNTGVFYALIAPIAMVFLFAGRMATRHSTPWVFPAALAYTLMGVMPLSYNVFGLEGAGAQFYFLAPVSLREVVLAKNLISFGLAALQTLATVLVTMVVLGRPSSGILLLCLLWAAATLLASTSLGNRRSLAAPRKIKLSKAAGKQVSPLSALMSLGILLLSAALGACVLVIARAFHLPWLPALIFATLFTGALMLYLHSLRHLDRYALDHREKLFAELCKS